MMLDTYTQRPPARLLAAKGALAALLIIGAVAPHLGGFDGKGMAWRLPIFLAPALIIPIRWALKGGRYPAALDAALTLPFLADTVANAVGLYDAVDATDDFLHFINWAILVAGITATLAANATSSPRWLTVTAGVGLGAAAIIGWEIAEYAVMQAGVGGLTLTYADTLSDLALSSVGGLVGAIVSRRIWTPDRPPPTGLHSP